MLGAGEGVTADTDDERLAKADIGRLRDGLVRERTGTGDDTCGLRQSRTLLARRPDQPMRPGVWMTPGWIPILQPAGLMIPGQLGPTRRDLDWLWRAWWTYTATEAVIRDTPTTVAKRSGTYANFILLGNALSDGDNEANLVFDRFNDCVGGGRWRDVEDGGIGLRLAHGLHRGHGQNDVQDPPDTVHAPP